MSKFEFYDPDLEGHEIDGTPNDFGAISPGDIISLSGKSKTGIEDIKQHGNIWYVRSLEYYNDNPAIHIESKRKSSNLGNEQTRKSRIIYLKNDNDFNIRPVEI